MSTKTMVTQDNTLCPLQILREGEGVAFHIPVRWATTLTGTPSQTFYKEGTTTDVSSTYLTGNSQVINTNVVETKTTTALKAGSWVMSVLATADGQTVVVATIPILVKRRSEL